ncbi:hypothetical protein ACLKA6_007561 [Drosophila palustris]
MNNYNAIARLRAHRNNLDQQIQGLQEPEGHVLKTKLNQLQEEQQKLRKNYKALEKKLKVQERQILELTKFYKSQQPPLHYLVQQQPVHFLAPQPPPPPQQNLVQQQPVHFLAQPPQQRWQ